MWLRNMANAWSCKFSTCVVSFRPEVSGKWEKVHFKNTFKIFGKCCHDDGILLLSLSPSLSLTLPLFPNHKSTRCLSLKIPVYYILSYTHNLTKTYGHKKPLWYCKSIFWNNGDIWRYSTYYEIKLAQRTVGNLPLFVARLIFHSYYIFKYHIHSKVCEKFRIKSFFSDCWLNWF